MKTPKTIPVLKKTPAVAQIPKGDETPPAAQAAGEKVEEPTPPSTQAPVASQPAAKPVSEVPVVEVKIQVPECKPSTEPDIRPEWLCWIGAIGHAFGALPDGTVPRDAVWYALLSESADVDGPLCSADASVVAVDAAHRDRAAALCARSGAGPCTVVVLTAEGVPAAALAYWAAAVADARATALLGAGAPLACDDTLRELAAPVVEPRLWAQATGPHAVVPRGFRRTFGVQTAGVWDMPWDAAALAALVAHLPAEFRSGPLGDMAATASHETADHFAAPHVRCGLEKRCVVAFSLYGGDARYTEGAIENAKLRFLVLPGWEMRFTFDGTVPGEVLTELRALGCETVDVATMGVDQVILNSKMTWRFLIADDADVDVYSIRDSDSRLSLREREAVREFVDSEALYHILRDHQSHNYAINGGMWGGKRNPDLHIADLIASSGVGSGYFADMSFLASGVWPKIQDTQLAHDSKTCEGWPNARGFPTVRTERKEHVGGVFDAQNGMRMSDVTPFNFASPPACEGRKTIADVINTV